MTKKLLKSLPVELTDDEVLIRAKELTVAMAEEEALIAKIKAFRSNNERTIKDVIRPQIAKLQDVVHTGVEDREVECEQRPDYTRKIMEIVRLDTDEVVESWQIKQAELQTALPVPTKPNTPSAPRAAPGKNGPAKGQKDKVTA